MYRARIFVIAAIAVGWSRIIVAQAAPHQSDELQSRENNTTRPPGIGSDWRRFGSGLEDNDRSLAANIRFDSGLEDDAPIRLAGSASIQPSHPGASVLRFGSGLERAHPMASRVRFGSGLEDDAPARARNVFHEPGF
jgi:hypothetical protein